MDIKLSRRNLLKTMAAGSAVLASGCATVGGGADKKESGAKPFHFAHLTDMHVRRKRRGDDGYRACIASVNALDPAPDFVIMGGDLAFDGNYTAKEEYMDQVELFKAISDGLTMPYYCTLGNHDGLGWGARRKVAIDDPDIGPAHIMKRVGMPARYYSFDHEGWHFVILDSMFEITTDKGPTYEARIGDEQLNWLRHDLGKAAGRPTIVVTHIAAFCNVGQINGDPEAKAMIGDMVLRDNKALREILERHGVKAVLQGHSHMTEDFIFNGVAYLTSPAVSACWWSGTWKGYPYGYTVFTCHPDGRFEYDRKSFEWETHLEPADDLERKNTAEFEKFQQEQKALLAEERG